MSPHADWVMVRLLLVVKNNALFLVQQILEMTLIRTVTGDWDPFSCIACEGPEPPHSGEFLSTRIPASCPVFVLPYQD